MLKIKIVAVGKVKEKYFSEGIAEYLKRISRFAEISVAEVKEENFSKEGEATYDRSIEALARDHGILK